MENLHDLMINKKLTISTVESCTGGLLGSYLTNIPNSSKYYRGGIIAYNSSVKSQLLNIPEDMEFVSEKCVVLMNIGLKKLIKSDIHVSISGYLGPNVYKSSLQGLVFYSISYLDIDHIVNLKIGNIDRILSKEFIVSNIINKLCEII